jgi:ribosomal protein S18 acetylase RimI-like enzyme
MLRRPVGRLWVAESEWEIRILDIAVLREFRGLGVATAVLRETIENARMTGRAARLSVRQDNTSALRLYRRLGFESCRVTDVYVEMAAADRLPS